MLIRIIPVSDDKISYSKFKKILEFFYLNFSELRIRRGNTAGRWVIEVETTSKKNKK